jgi:hypothetical protein
MGIDIGPIEVVDNLYIQIDAANPRSYSGSGLTSSGLVGGIGVTLVNGTGFSSSNNGSFIFDGSDDYIRLPTNFFNPDSGSPFTVSIWFKTSTPGVILGQQNTINPGTISGYVPAIYIDTNGKLRTSCFWGGSTTNQSLSSISVNDNKWHQVSVTFESSSHKSYVDGMLFDTISKNQVSYSVTYYYFIGSGTNAAWPSAGNMTLTGNISNFIFYNKALTATEIFQNYHATKGRYR